MSSGSPLSTQGSLLDDRGAELSDCGLYRYRLWRVWGPGPHALFVMLNPSTADADRDDPTIRKCMGFARRWSLNGIQVCNLFAWRATDPTELERIDAPLGDPHDDHQYRAVMEALLHVGVGGRILAAWGASKLADQYERRMLSLLSWGPLPVEALRLTKAGAPGHPLYVPYDVKPVVYASRPFLQETERENR